MIGLASLASLCIGATPAVLTLVSGCAVSMPSGGFTDVRDDATGSIRRLSPMGLDGEDWRRAYAALATALDPQGAGTQVKWDNPASGIKGAFTPVGAPYEKNAKVCRAFVADIAEASTDRSLQGTACMQKGSDWSITESKPWRRA